MDIFFQDPSEVPLPPNEVRIRELRAEPWPDGRRVLVYLEVDPFQKRPSAEVEITNSEGQIVSHVSVIESMSRKMEFTMHLRQAQVSGEYRLFVNVFYTDPLPEPQEGETEPPELPEPQVVDTAEAHFVIEPS
ncbi:MAG: hypothetical protein EHM41_22865 [Chloroflexi bacterium]|nr:MAG: hypothetical protein EHM41_22865 [Chloroflexota bacterium]